MALMEALQFDPQTTTLKYVKVPAPSATKDNEVLVEVAYAGFCGSDLHMLKGEHPCTNVPFVMGHEFSGTVLAVGSSVFNVKPGDRVAVDPNRGCNVCSFCASGNYTHCKNPMKFSGIGCFRDGGWANYCVIPDVQVHKLPDDVSLENGALVEPLSCVCHGWERVSPVSIGERVLVQGAGIIGLLWISILHVQGHQNVTVSEPVEHRRKVVAQLETGYEIITPNDLKLKRKNNPSYKFDLIIDCSGYGPAIEEALDLLENRGKLCIFGMPAPPVQIQWKPYLIFKNELSVIGTYVNHFCFQKAMSMMSALGKRYADYKKLGIKIYALSDYEAAVKDLKSGNISKAIFKTSPKK